ncbi:MULTISPECIES: TIGR03757 family integrating conjugative element protein [Pseudomonas]|uniref:TIGR03757 family integrating conjugative element protein n=1 Tax=Pseudomonas proteolytica TaxID=219574 RepID=A0AAW5A9N6_9PSED|nr:MULTISPECIES: TIGR03757 family integrating conjugative element protein [Pseudomonas]KAA0945756.1 TIGR03757 family integrating conjugative element protein [Pseudomonas sp. ANT_H4]KAA0951605.1 TIGR03757 family integrating conjugative element protein [Pseudomonas sp. ANT_H14]KAA8704875.1 TIGR03757 family integrating conjugative element protein [Pseudomonas proteolytica]MCF5056523.1 TIGR03757 family integrating conjugative element protein [Pseudomonas proteolytica]MCF5102545.1 TIGR03757 family 
MLCSLSPGPIRCLALAIALCASAASAMDIWVISDRQHPVQGTPDRLIELDAPARIEAELSTDLPSDVQQASLLVQQRLKHGGPTLEQRLARTYQDVTDAWRLGITTLPAIVVDQRYVVYGEPGVAKAIARIEAYRRTQP